MDAEGQPGKSLKHMSGQVCQICGEDVGTTVDGELFVACDVCAFPVCRPCYEYERKDGNQSCLQCKTRYKKHKGSPPVHGDEVGDGDADAVVSDFNYSYVDPIQKKKIAERMLSWQMSYGRGEDVGAPKYDRDEVPHNQIPQLTDGPELSGELPVASPDRLTMPSPGGGGGKRVHPLPYADVNQSPNLSREFNSQGFGNVAWKERVDGWKLKQDKNVGPMSTGGHGTSEGRGAGDIDASTDVNMDDALLNDEARQPLSRKVSIPSSRINPYRMVIILRLIILSIFLHYRITNPVPNAYACG